MTRRSHAERTAQTRAKVKGAVVDSIADVGFQRTTAAEIVRRAGVTWGAVQHHFGGKDGILRAVLDDSFDHFAALLADAPLEGASLEKRVTLFVDRAWEHFGSPRYRSTFEILLHDSGQTDGDPERTWTGEMLDAWNRVWSAFFDPGTLSRRRRVVLQRYTISVLSGLASMQVLEGEPARPPTAELALLKETLVRALEGG